MRRIFILVLQVICTLTITAQTTGKARLQAFAFSETTYINKLSDNGLWAVASNVDANDATLYNYPYLLDITKGTSISLLSEAEKLSSPDCCANDITDDGKTVVGAHQGKPAICRIGDNGSVAWEYLPTPSYISNARGHIIATTPDGSCMVGTVTNNSQNFDGGYKEYPVMWKNGELVELPNIPTGRDGYELSRLMDISANGNILIGGLMYIYPSYIQQYVYYVAEQKAEIIGTSEFFSTGSTVTTACMSTNGEWVGGKARLITPIEGSQFPDEQEIPYRYNTRTKEFTAYTTSEHHEAATTAIFNNGLMAVASPIGNPYRTQMYFIDGYYYNLELILSERYGIDFMSASGIDNSGLAISTSADGKTIACFSVNEGNYVFTLPETIEEAAKGVNLLARSTVSPAAGSSFSYFRSIAVTFDKAPTVVSGKQAALYKEGSDTPVRTSANIAPANDLPTCTTFNINFRNTPLEDGVKYTVKVPAGTFRLGNTDTYNRDIEVTYVGRSEKPVKVVGVNLEDGTEVASLSYNIPVAMQFDTEIALTEGSKGSLYQEGISTPISDLTLATSANMLAAYPGTKRNLFKGINYIVKIPAGAVTDITGSCANEEITYTYVGAYVPEPPADTLLFADDFTDPSTSYNNFMLYEGDHLTPNSTAQAWQFDADNTPWYFGIRESEDSYDYCAGSVSMYNPAGKSDDWMVTTQIYLPNEYCYLDFNVQSYLSSKKDSLRIYIYTDDAVYTAINKDFIDRVKAEGVCIHAELATPGGNQEYLSGDWMHYRIPLGQFAEKNIYIAFANECTNQSALFVDDIEVVYKSNCLLALNSKTTVVNQSETTVSGVVKITDETNTYNEIKVFFRNEEGTVSDTLHTTNISLKKGDIFEFSFNKKMPLAIGEENTLTVGVILGEDTKTTDFIIKNLAFETTKRVVIEEVTGTWCSNCPDGMVAIEHMQEALPGQIIPVCIHNQDIYANDDYMTALGLTALPTARVNRRDTITSPIVINTDTYEYSFTSVSGNESWMDHVLKELETEADANITLSKAEFDRKTGNLTVSTDVTYAISKAGVTANLFFVLLEDGLMGVQTNGRANMTDPIYGDWGKNGKYGGQASVQIAYHDVARAILAESQSTISGYSGLIPATVKSGQAINNNITIEGALTALANPLNGKVVCMLLDANTGRVINADVCNLTDADPYSIDEMAETHVSVTTQQGNIIVTATKARIALYTSEGWLLDETYVCGSATLNTNGYQGIAIVHILCDGQAEVRKLLVK
ncbi:MAG: choice-of-anchor J domain-containing protein [Bacteroidaceae bacterium]|nr:choice-of-anchor J domain-containing protein [Bacteroidaceae bacterium]